MKEPGTNDRSDWHMVIPEDVLGTDEGASPDNEVQRAASQFSEAIAGFFGRWGTGDLITHHEWRDRRDTYFAAGRLR